MNDSKNEKKIEKKEFEVEIGDKKYKVKITDEKVDISGKKNGDTIKVKADLTEKKDNAAAQSVDLEGKLNIGWYGDSITLNKSTGTVAGDFKSEIKPWSARMHKPVLWITIAVVALAIIGLIWWWVASSKKEDKEEESL